MDMRYDRQTITPRLLLKAYSCGLFPMAEMADDPHVFWVEPEIRGIIPLDRFRVPRRLARTCRQGRFAVRLNTAFEAVIDGCAAPTPSREKTWINRTIRDLYVRLHGLGFAHSIEAWRGDRLVGGLYGVSLRGAFFGESMFSRERDASKVCLVHLVARLRERSYRLFDIQFTNDHLKRFGAIDIRKQTYDALLRAAMRVEARFDRGPARASRETAHADPDRPAP